MRTHRELTLKKYRTKAARNKLIDQLDELSAVAQTLWADEDQAEKSYTKMQRAISALASQATPANESFDESIESLLSIMRGR